MWTPRARCSAWARNRRRNLESPHSQSLTRLPPEGAGGLWAANSHSLEGAGRLGGPVGRRRSSRCLAARGGARCLAQGAGRNDVGGRWGRTVAVVAAAAAAAVVAAAAVAASGRQQQQ